MVFSLLYFKSCGCSPKITPGYISQFLPICVPDLITECDLILVPDSIVTSSSIMQKGPINTSFAILALELTIAFLSILFIMIYLYLQLKQGMLI